MTTAHEVIEKLGLTPLPMEGGYYRETHRSPLILPVSALPPGYPDSRPACTAIYYLITDTTFSALHRLRGAEMWHFYLGDPVEQIQLPPDGSGRIVRLGHDFDRGCAPQGLVAGGVWQSTRLVRGGAFALLGTTMAPGFDFEEYEHGEFEELSRRYPLLNEWATSG